MSKKEAAAMDAFKIGEKSKEQALADFLEGKKGLTSKFANVEQSQFDQIPQSYVDEKFVPMVIGKCMNDFNTAIKNSKSVRHICRAVALFWSQYLFMLYPLNEGRHTTAEFISQATLARVGLQLTTYKEIQKYQVSGNLMDDVNGIEKVMLQSLSKISDNDKATRGTEH